MSARVISAGLWTTIQDRGRFGFAEYGVPESGVMDKYCAAFTNLLLQNDPDDAVMEITLQGPKLLFEDNTLFTVTGLEAEIFLDDNLIELNSVYKIRKGQTLNVRQITQGARVYIAIKGGFKTDEILGSHSFYNPVTPQNRLKGGDIIPFIPCDKSFKERKATLRFSKEQYKSDVMEVYPGPEWLRLPEIIRQEIQLTSFSVSNNNSRMAYQLEEKIENDLKGITTQPVLPGTVQLTPAGNLIILMRDCQVTGGYPRVFQLTERSVNLLSQKKRGDGIVFDMKNYPE